MHLCLIVVATASQVTASHNLVGRCALQIWTLPSTWPVSNVPYGPGLMHVALALPTSKATEALPVAEKRLHQPPMTAQLCADLKSCNTAAVMPRWPAWVLALAHLL
jgi:hypothetical protein